MADGQQMSTESDPIGSNYEVDLSRRSLEIAGRPSTTVPIESIINHDELIDLRAYQRTFDGAYSRTALGELGFAIVVLRLFDRTFYWCGLIYTVLAVQLIFLGVYRYNLAVANDDRWEKVQLRMAEHHRPSVEQTEPGEADTTPTRLSHTAHVHHRSFFRPTFRTAGVVVATATLSTLVLEIVLMVLILRT